MADVIPTEQDRKVVIEGASSPISLDIGVPQGSLLGPLLFTLYLQPIGNIIRDHGLTFDHYADDPELYSHFYLNSTALAHTMHSAYGGLHHRHKSLDGSKLPVHE